MFRLLVVFEIYVWRKEGYDLSYGIYRSKYPKPPLLQLKHLFKSFLFFFLLCSFLHYTFFLFSIPPYCLSFLLHSFPYFSPSLLSSFKKYYCCKNYGNLKCILLNKKTKFCNKMLFWLPYCQQNCTPNCRLKVHFLVAFPKIKLVYQIQI